MHGTRRWSLLTILVLISFTLPWTRASAEPGVAYVPAAPKRSLFIVGDSLIVGAESFGHLVDKLKARGFWSSVRIDAAVSRKIPRGIEIVTKQLRANPSTGAFIVGLGTNDLLSHKSAAYHAADAERLIKAVKGKPVLWINVTYAAWRKDWVAKAKLFAVEMNKLARKYPNLTVASWYSYFPTNSPYWSVKDGIHLSPTGYKTRATFILSSAATWWRKVTTPPATTTTSSIAPSSTQSSIDGSSS